MILCKRCILVLVWHNRHLVFLFLFFYLSENLFVLFFFFLHISTFSKTKKKQNKMLPRVRFWRKKNVWCVCNFSNPVAGVFPLLSRFPPPLSALPELPDLICTSRSTEDYGQAEAGGNRRLWFPRLCFTTAGKQRETLKLSHVQWHPRKKKTDNFTATYNQASRCIALESKKQLWVLQVNKVGNTSPQFVKD